MSNAKAYNFCVSGDTDESANVADSVVCLVNHRSRERVG